MRLFWNTLCPLLCCHSEGIYQNFSSHHSSEHGRKVSRTFESPWTHLLPEAIFSPLFSLFLLQKQSRMSTSPNPNIDSLHSFSIVTSKGVDVSCFFLFYIVFLYIRFCQPCAYALFSSVHPCPWVSLWSTKKVQPCSKQIPLIVLNVLPERAWSSLAVWGHADVLCLQRAASNILPVYVYVSSFISLNIVCCFLIYFSLYLNGSDI